MILMNCNDKCGAWGLKWISLKQSDLRRIRDQCGVTVVEEQIYWNQVEKKRGSYDWSISDRQVNRVLGAGMKLIMCVPMAIPGGLPNEWYWKGKGGGINKSGLSYWNADAQAYQRAFVERVIERYSGPGISFIYHGFLGGESAMWNNPVFFDDAALADFKQKYGGTPEAADSTADPPFALSPNTKEWLRDGVVSHHLFIQEPFMKQHNEVWDNLQPNIALQSEANGNYAQYDIHQAYKETWPDVEHWLLMYTYWNNGPWSAEQIDRLVEDFDCKVIVEANYCESLPGTTELALDKGFFGQIVCPLHPFRNHARMEPWMYDAIKQAVNLWKTCSD